MSAEAHGSHAEHKEPNYMAVFAVLFVFTVLEIAVVFLPILKAVIVASLVALALAKATLVAAFFMHLKFERRTLAVIAATPLVLCGFLLFMLLPDAR